MQILALGVAVFWCLFFLAAGLLVLSGILVVLRYRRTQSVSMLLTGLLCIACYAVSLFALTRLPYFIDYGIRSQVVVYRAIGVIAASSAILLTVVNKGIVRQLQAVVAFLVAFFWSAELILF